MFRRGLVFVLTLVVAFSFTALPSHAKTTKAMTIYGFYLQRDGEKAVWSDRYGDAILIQSGGKYLLMDTGDTAPIKGSSEVHKSNLVSSLKKIGVKELDVYISHFHIDHTGGLEDVLANFKVNKVYLPDKSLAKDYYTPNTLKPISEIYAEREAQITAAGASIVYLCPSCRTAASSSAVSSFSFGTVSCKVIGPVGDFTIDQFASKDGEVGTKEGHYLNNYSLVTLMTCGSIKYLTAGDIETEEESKLVSKYGTSLNADIMKANHHGLSTSNKSAIVSKVTPKWTVMQNHGYYSTEARNLLGKYGYNFAAGSIQKTEIITVSNNLVRIYKDTNGNCKADESPYKGWISTGSNYQYYNSSGHIVSGWVTSGYNHYYMSSVSGLRLTGTHTISRTTCKFSSSGLLTSPVRPATVSITSARSTSGSRAVTLKWKKANKATYYQIYKYSPKRGYYVLMKTTKARSYKNSGLSRGSTYKYKIRAKRYAAGITLYGNYSKVVSVKAK